MFSSQSLSLTPPSPLPPLFPSIDNEFAGIFDSDTEREKERAITRFWNTSTEEGNWHGDQASLSSPAIVQRHPEPLHVQQQSPSQTRQLDQCSVRPDSPAPAAAAVAVLEAAGPVSLNSAQQNPIPAELQSLALSINNPTDCARNPWLFLKLLERINPPPFKLMVELDSPTTATTTAELTVWSVVADKPILFSVFLIRNSAAPPIQEQVFGHFFPLALLCDLNLTRSDPQNRVKVSQCQFPLYIPRLPSSDPLQVGEAQFVVEATVKSRFNKDQLPVISVRFECSASLHSEELRLEVRRRTMDQEAKKLKEAVWNARTDTTA